tara:strand:+ start:10892 stop:11044 length:153 start_codon:yes stop_codon:yes gene_type:complete
MRAAGAQKKETDNLEATHRGSGNSLEPVLCGQNVRENNSKNHEAGGQNKN